MATRPPGSKSQHPARGAVVSDLHLFARRSDGQHQFSQFESKLGHLDAIVLNGDTFDFRWSQLHSETESITAATRWLESLIERRPGCDIHFLRGNHDCLAAFTPALLRLSSDHARFHCHDHRLQLGDLLFLHGDCTNRRMDLAALERFRESWSHDRQRGRLAASLYSAVDATGLCSLFHHCYFPAGQTVARVAHHLDHVLPGWPQVISRCYFGHTHRPVHGFENNGVHFFNTGSGIRGMGFAPLSFGWSGDPPQTTIQ